MTTIDTSIYLDGALRLSQHGAGRGGNVLTNTATGQQADINDEGVLRIDSVIANMSKKHFGADRAQAIFAHLAAWYPKQVRTSAF